MIVGQSDAGKSAVLRALRGVCLGQPDGEELVRHDAGGYAVKLVVAGREIVRVRRKGKNVYVLDGETLTRDRGAWPPPQVLAAANLIDTNFQSQLDAPLWFLDSAGQVAKHLNAAVDLRAIDAAVNTAATDAKRAEQDRRGAEAEHADASEGYAALKWVPAMLAAHAVLQERQERLAESRQNALRLREFCERLSAQQRAISRARTHARAASGVLAAGRRAIAAGDRAVRLKELLKRITRNQKKLKAAGRIVEAWSPVASVRVKTDAIIERRAKLEYALESLTSKRKAVREWEKKSELAVAEYSEMSKCPACGRPLPSSRSSSATCT